MAIAKKILSIAETEQWCLQHLRDEEVSIRQDAIIIISEIGTTKPEEIIPSLKDSDYKVRAWAARALGEWGNAEAIAKLLDALKDSHWLVRGNAVIALGKLCPIERKEQVLEKLNKEIHSFVIYMRTHAFLK